MEKSTRAALQTLRQQTLEALRKCISSPGSADGRLPCASPTGPKIGPYGLEVVPASPTASSASAPVLTTPAISGPTTAASLRSASLQSSLENRLQALMGASGSAEYELTWKRWDMESGPSILALRASGRRISGNASSSSAKGWTSPTAVDGRRGNLPPRSTDTGIPLSQEVQAVKGWPTPCATEPDQLPEQVRARKKRLSKSTGVHRGPALPLGSEAYMVKGWTTPQAHDSSPRGKGQKPKHGTKHGCADLNADAQTAGWPTPMALAENRGGLQSNPQKALERREQGHTLNLDDAACLVTGWATPRQADGHKGQHHAADQSTKGTDLPTMSGWATPTQRDHKDGASTLENVPINGLLGRQVSLSPALTESTGESQPQQRASLNPRFSLWLMGFPIEWAHCAERVMLSTRTKRRHLSAPAAS